MIKLIDAVTDYIHNEYKHFIELCERRGRKVKNYTDGMGRLLNAINTLMSRGIVNYEGVCDETLEKCLEKYGDVVLYYEPVFDNDDGDEYCPVRLRTILESDKNWMYINITNYIIK